MLDLLGSGVVLLLTLLSATSAKINEFMNEGNRLRSTANGRKEVMPYNSYLKADTILEINCTSPSSLSPRQRKC